MAYTRDGKNSIEAVNIISPISPANTGVISGAVVDLEDCSGFLITIMSGLTTTNNVSATPVVYTGSTSGSLTSESDANLIGTEAAAVLSGDAEINSNATIGYIGSNRFIKVNLTVANAASGVYAVLGQKLGLRKKPVS